MPGLLLIGLATLVSEDLACIATGVLIARHKLDPWGGIFACLLGIYAGDLALFATGRLVGRAALSWAPFRRFVPPAQVDRASAWLSARGPTVVFLSRFTPGLRLPTYFVAGLLRTDPVAFAAWFLAAAALWTPALVGVTALAGERAAVHLRSGLPLFVVAIALYWLLKRLCGFRTRRRLVGFYMRKVRWEFWPAWAAYLPLLPYFAYLAVKYRSLTLFTLANPGIPSGGFAGESKSAILDHLSRIDGAVPLYTLIPATVAPGVRLCQAHRFLEAHALSFPVVLKPDVGERGAGVAVIRSEGELTAQLHAASVDMILQQYAPGLEFGVFYFRHPGEPVGHISSITAKHFPELAGDGIRTREELILADPRAVCLAGAYARASRLPLDDVPAVGERILLVEIGSHCRGAIFLDAGHLRTPALEAAIDRLSRSHPGFYFGRYDVRARSIHDFQQGCFQVIELNGVSAEATHVYDPAVSLIEAYRVLFRNWKLAFTIGAANRARGFRPMPLQALLELSLRRDKLDHAAADPPACRLQSVGGRAACGLD